MVSILLTPGNRSSVYDRRVDLLQDVHLSNARNKITDLIAFTVEASRIFFVHPKLLQDWLTFIIKPVSYL